jgi:hypothetical protein
MRSVEQRRLLKAEPDGYSDGMVALVLPMLPPTAASLGTPFFGSITIAISL